MFPGWLIVGASFAYLLLLFAVAYFGDRRADAGRSVIDNPGSSAFAGGVLHLDLLRQRRRAASGGPWFLPTYLGPTLGCSPWPGWSCSR